MKPDLHDFLLNAPTLRSDLKTITSISFCSEELSLYRTRSGAPVERFVQEEIFKFFLNLGYMKEQQNLRSSLGGMSIVTEWE